MVQTDWIARAAVIAAFASGIAACGGEAGGGGPIAVGLQEAPADSEDLNQPPIIVGTPSATAVEDAFYEFVPSALDPDGDPVVFGIDGKPAWLDFDDSSGRLFGTPSFADIGTYSGIVIWVSDGKSESALPALELDVAAAPQPENLAPVISGSPPGSVMVGDFYDFVPVATDDDGDALGFSVQNLPGWAEFDPGSGRLWGTPAGSDVGSYRDIVVGVSDGEATAVLAAFAVEVLPPPIINSAPTISGQPATRVLAGAEYRFTPDASDIDGDSLSFSAVNLPAWAHLDSGSGTLSGVPQAADAGIYGGISIVVGDGAFSVALDSFSIEVIAPNTPPTISGAPAAKTVKNESYSFIPEAGDADGDTLSFTIVGQPSWATFDDLTGALGGTPSAADIGLYRNISIVVSDGEDESALGPFSIEVLAVGSRAAELSWLPPTENTDGSPLTNLSGYVIYWGMTKGNYTHSVTVANPGLTRYVVEQLAPAQTYFFTVTAYNEDGLESSYSNEASKHIPEDQ